MAGLLAALRQLLAAYVARKFSGRRGRRRFLRRGARAYRLRLVQSGRIRRLDGRSVGVLYGRRSRPAAPGRVPGTRGAARAGRQGAVLPCPRRVPQQRGRGAAVSRRRDRRGHLPRAQSPRCGGLVGILRRPRRRRTERRHAQRPAHGLARPRAAAVAPAAARLVGPRSSGPGCRFPCWPCGTRICWRIPRGSSEESCVFCGWPGRRKPLGCGAPLPFRHSPACAGERNAKATATSIPAARILFSVRARLAIGGGTCPRRRSERSSRPTKRRWPPSITLRRRRFGK